VQSVSLQTKAIQFVLIDATDETGIPHLRVDGCQYARMNASNVASVDLSPDFMNLLPS
jgi:hypothetical protein